MKALSVHLREERTGFMLVLVIDLIICSEGTRKEEAVA